MSHWDSCNAIERRPDKVSGAWIFENTRLPVATLFEALKNSPAIDQFLDDFEGVTRQQVLAVPRQLYLPVGVNQFCRFTSLAWTRCWAALVR